MELSPRQQAILDLARTQGRVLVDELARHFEVTPQTIRRDLNELCEGRLLVRSHGGASIGSGVENLGYQARRFIAAEQKRAIGRAAAALIPDHSSLFITIGTTTEEVARALVGRQGLLVITNNLNVATMLYPSEGIEVIMAGGPVRRADGAVVGAAAVDFIRQFKVDHAVIGVSAIEPDGALLDYDHREVRVSRAIMENARKVVLVADSTKFERTAPIRIGELGDIDSFVTDLVRNPAMRDLLRRQEVALVETDGER